MGPCLKSHVSSANARSITLTTVEDHIKARGHLFVKAAGSIRCLFRHEKCFVLLNTTPHISAAPSSRD